jgi:hypothetical protein
MLDRIGCPPEMRFDTPMRVYVKTSMLFSLVAFAACSGGGASVAPSASQTSAVAIAPAAAQDVSAGSLPAATGSAGLSTAAHAASIATASAAAASSTEAAIDAGGGSAGSWIADSDYSGGWVSTTSSTINTSLVSSPAPQGVYRSQRNGTAFTYTIPGLAANGSYTVRLHFVESFFSSAGQRIFNVYLNGSQVLSNFDEYASANGRNIAIVKALNVNADGSGKIAVRFNAVTNNASVAGIEIIGGTVSGGGATPASTPTPTPMPTTVTSTSGCAPDATNPVLSGCFTGNSPYHQTVASLIAAGATVHNDSTAINYWRNGQPLTGNLIHADGSSATIIFESSAGDPQYSVSCPAYGTCDAATSVTGLKVHIPSGASATSGSDHHIFIFDTARGLEMDMWGGYASNEACQVGTLTAGVLTCSWGGTFPLSGNGLAAVAGDSGIAGGVAYGMAAITAGDILSGHITHALGIIGPCLDNNGQYPATKGRSTDSSCAGHAAGGGNGAEPTLRYGDMLHLKSSVNLNAAPYSGYSPYCKVVVRALQEYGAYADDNASNWGLQLVALDQSSPGWQTIMASMISGGDASGSPSSAAWPSCLNRIGAGDVETVTLNQGGNSALP